MTFRTRHEFIDGATILGAQLATCPHCGTQRVTEPSRHPQPRYILPGCSDAILRDGYDMPPCIEPRETKGAKERVLAMNRARARDAAVRAAVLAAPEEEREEERDPPRMLTHFPWYSDMHR